MFAYTEEGFEPWDFECETCGCTYHVSDAQEEYEVLLYCECPNCVAAYNAQ